MGLCAACHQWQADALSLQAEQARWLELVASWSWRAPLLALLAVFAESLLLGNRWLSVALPLAGCAFGVTCVWLTLHEGPRSGEARVHQVARSLLGLGLSALAGAWALASVGRLWN
jgi:hypothetical protein